MMYTNNNNNHFAFVVRRSSTAVNSIEGTALTASMLADGDVVLVDRHNQILVHDMTLATRNTNDIAAGASTLKFKVASKAGGKLYYSPLLSYADLTISTGKATAAAQQVTNIGGSAAGVGGYLLPNAASENALAQAEVGNSFYVLIEKQDNDEANRMGYHPAITAQVKMKDTSGSSNFTFENAEELQINLAAQLREAIAKNDALEVATPATAGPKYVRAKVVANVATQANICGGANNATFTFGSKTVTTDANTEAGIANVDYLNVAGDLYKIAADPGTTDRVITLEDPYRGPSATITTGTAADEVGFNTQAHVQAATSLGVELVGMPQAEFDVTRERISSESRFNARFAKDGENVGATITRTTAAAEGLGNFEQVASEEYHSFGNLGLRWVSDIPAQVRPANAVDASYGCITLREVIRKNNALIGQTVGKTTVNLWFELAGTAGLVFTASDNQIQETLRDQFAVATTDLGN